jgi:pimeloyl-ACP methyl ester carboxylesterase
MNYLIRRPSGHDDRAVTRNDRVIVQIDERTVRRRFISRTRLEINMPRYLLAGLIVAFCFIQPRPSWAQPERYELGRRIRAFEAAWAGQPDAEARKRATEPLKRAVGLFFGFRLGDAGCAMADARFALRSQEGPGQAEEWAASLDLRPSARLIDAERAILSAQVLPSYPVETPAPAAARLVVRMGQANRTIADVSVDGETWPREAELNVMGVGEGDHVLHAAIKVAGRELGDIDVGLSIAKDLQSRLDTLRRLIAAWPDGTTTDRETARALLELVDKLASGVTLEADYPAARLLKEVETIVAAVEDGRAYFDRTKTGQHWITLALPGGGKGVVRVQVPDEAARGAKLPLVLALHGAGGSENMFFDAYGNGAIVSLCHQRGWLLASPRVNGMSPAQVGALIDALAAIYPIDRSRIMLVGHSMGAMQALGMASLDPRKYAAVAALGGGGAVKPAPGIESLPFFVGVGTEDFALAAVRGLNGALKRADVRTVSYHEYEAVEHMAIVQTALPDVFTFFDNVVMRGGR